MGTRWPDKPRVRAHRKPATSQEDTGSRDAWALWGRRHRVGSPRQEQQRYVSWAWIRERDKEGCLAPDPIPCVGTAGNEQVSTSSIWTDR